MNTRNKRFMGIVLLVVLTLSIPFIAMQFTDEVKWDQFDFLVGGILLLGTGLIVELVMRTVKNKNYRWGLIAIILIMLFLIWAELAVGIFGSPYAGS